MTSAVAMKGNRGVRLRSSSKSAPWYGLARIHRKVSNCGAKSLQKQAKTEEKVEFQTEGVNRCVTRGEKRTTVLFKFLAIVPMIRGYAEPLLLPTTCQKSGNASCGTFRQ